MGNGKKGRGALGAAAQAGQDVTKTGQDLTSQGRKIADSEINTSGGLSPLVAKQLANEQGLIGKTYSDASRAADRGLSMRGMGVAPSGLTASICTMLETSACRCRAVAPSRVGPVRASRASCVTRYCFPIRTAFNRPERT